MIVLEVLFSIVGFIIAWPMLLAEALMWRFLWNDFASLGVGLVLYPVQVVWLLFLIYLVW